MVERKITVCDRCDEQITDDLLLYQPFIVAGKKPSDTKLILTSVGSSPDPSGNNDREYRYIKLDLCAGCSGKLVDAICDLAKRAG